MNLNADLNISKFLPSITEIETIDSQMSKSAKMITNLNVPRPKCSISPIDELATYDMSGMSYINPTTLITLNDQEQKLIQNDSILNLYNQYSPMNILNKPLRSILTVSNTSNDSGCHSYENSLSSSPYCVLNESKFKSYCNKNLLVDAYKNKTHFQSTPNKSVITSHDTECNAYIDNSNSKSKSKERINFHRISDLATSSSTYPIQFEDEQKSIRVDENSNKIRQMNNANSIQIQNGIKNQTFNEQLKLMSYSLVNKENTHEFIYKGKRKPRTQITKEQKEILEYAYKLKCYPDSNEVEYLCQILGFEENVIRIWFQNKRARDKLRH